MLRGEKGHRVIIAVLRAGAAHSSLNFALNSPTQIGLLPPPSLCSSIILGDSADSSGMMEEKPAGVEEGNDLLMVHSLPKDTCLHSTTPLST